MGCILRDEQGRLVKVSKFYPDGVDSLIIYGILSLSTINRIYSPYRAFT
jgi:hypothetical protein